MSCLFVLSSSSAFLHGRNNNKRSVSLQRRRHDNHRPSTTSRPDLGGGILAKKRRFPPPLERKREGLTKYLTRKLTKSGWNQISLSSSLTTTTSSLSSPFSLLHFKFFFLPSCSGLPLALGYWSAISESSFNGWMRLDQLLGHPGCVLYLD